MFDIIENSAVSNADKFKDWVLSELALIKDNSLNQSSNTNPQDQICDYEWLENRIQNIFSATNFIMSAFCSYVENKENSNVDIVYYPQNLSSAYLSYKNPSELVKTPKIATQKIDVLTLSEAAAKDSVHPSLKVAKIRAK